MKLTSYEIHPPRFSLGDLPLLAYDGTCVMAGDVCSLKGYNGTSVVLVATSAASFKEMDKALDAEDWEGIKQMLIVGSVVNPSVGDRIRVPDLSVLGGWTEGRITTGKHSGRHVWALTHLVHK